jgi:hypothetical protein
MPYVAYPWGGRGVGLGRQRGRSKREADVSDRRGALIGTLSRRGDFDRLTRCTPRRVAEFSDRRGEWQQARRRRRKKRYAYVPHVFALDKKRYPRHSMRWSSPSIGQKERFDIRKDECSIRKANPASRDRRHPPACDGRGVRIRPLFRGVQGHDVIASVKALATIPCRRESPGTSGESAIRRKVLLPIQVRRDARTPLSLLRHPRFAQAVVHRRKIQRRQPSPSVGMASASLPSGRSIVARPTVKRKSFLNCCRGLGLSFRDTDLSHGLVDLPPPGHKDQVVAWRVSTIAADGESGIDGKSVLRRGARFIESAEACQGDGEVETPGRKIPVGLDRAAQFSDRFFILAKKDFHRPVEAPPKIDGRIARATSVPSCGRGPSLPQNGSGFRSHRRRALVVARGAPVRFRPAPRATGRSAAPSHMRQPARPCRVASDAQRAFARKRPGSARRRSNALDKGQLASR